MIATAVYGTHRTIVYDTIVVAIHTGDARAKRAGRRKQTLVHIKAFYNTYIQLFYVSIKFCKFVRGLIMGERESRCVEVDVKK
jgi:hypothetical protein